MEPGVPPVPLIVLPFERVLPAEPLAVLPALAPELPPELCAYAMDKLPNSRLTIIANTFMVFPHYAGNQ